MPARRPKRPKLPRELFETRTHAWQSLGLEIGTAFRMGPGYFPLVLALILVLLGVVVIVQATRVAGEPLGEFAWRGMAFILPAPVFFGLTVRGLGFVPALFLTSLIAAFASARMRPLPALALAFAVTVFARGLLHRLSTRVYLPADEAAIAADPLLSTLPAEPQSTGSSTAMHSTWCVIGKASQASRCARRNPWSRAALTSRASAAGSHAT